MPLRERLLVVGIQGAGKTYGCLSLAQALPKHTFHVIDPDDGVERLRLKEFPELSNIKYYFTPTWYEPLTLIGKGRWQGGIADAAKEILGNHKDGDWIVLEQMSTQWDMAQEAFTDAVFEQDIGRYFLERRMAMQSTPKGKEAKRLDAFDGWKDWTVIKKIHNDDYFIKLCYRTKAHLYATTTFSVVQSDLIKDPEIAQFYSGTHIRIDGEKHIPLRVQSCLVVSGNPTVGWKLTTFQKDRGRRFLKEVVLHDMYYQYLVAVAGWEA